MSKTKKKGVRSLAILLALILTLGFSPVTNAEAKSAPRLNYKKVTLVQGKKKKLKIKGTKKRVKWYSTKKSVATVNKKGVVKAKKKGKAIIVAKVGKKKYRCKVTVKKKTSKKKTKVTNKKKTTSNVKKQLSYYAGALAFPGALKIGEDFDVINYNSDYSINKNCKISNNVRAKFFKWYVKDTSILTINKYGIASGKKTGSTKVSCRYMTKDGSWKVTKTVTVKVVAADDFKLTYSISLDAEKAKNAKYHIWNTEKKKLFNTINVNVTNTSDRSIKLANIVEFRIGSNSFIFSSNGNTEFLAGESKTIIYQSSYYYDAVYAKCFENYILDYEDVGSVWFTYYSNNKKFYYVHHREKYAHSPRENYWEYR